MNFSNRLTSINTNSKNFLPICLILLFVFTVLIFLRYPPLILEPRLWAEEFIYYETFLHVENWWEGFDALIYPAYYIGLARLAGLLSSFTEIQNAPLITTLFSFFFLFSPLLIIFLTDCKYWHNLQQKIILSLFLIFSCSTGEIWLTSTNLGFIMPIITFLILLDDNLKSRAKRSIYSCYLFAATITGPISLIMSPFFFWRYIQRREKQVFFYCLIFLVFGLFHILFFFISSSMEVGATNRISLELGWIERITHLVSFNVIFPFFGYFFSIIFRIGVDLINTGLENVSYLHSITQILPLYLANFFLKFVDFVYNLKIPLNLLISSLVIYFFYIQFKRSNNEERLNFLSLFIYLSIVINFLSLGGYGGFRYSYLTSFILLFFFYQKFLREGKIFKHKLTKVILISSIIIGVLEYYPRMISYSPEVVRAGFVDWPKWKEEVKKWEKDSTYKPLIWPYIKEQDILWPKRSELYSINLTRPEYWEHQGKNKFSSSLLMALSEMRKENNSLEKNQDPE